MRILRIVSLMIRELITSRELTYKILANLLFMRVWGNRELNYQEVKSKTKKQNNPESFSRPGDFKRHTILAKISVFTILLEKTGLYVMIDTGQLKS